MIRSIFSISTVFTVLLIMAAIGTAFGYPYSINSIPTADTYGANNLVIDLSNYGYPKMMRSDSPNWICLQYGIGPNIEVGVDRASDGTTHEEYLNAKWKVFSENGKLPAFAVGSMDVNDSGKPSFYSVASRTFGKFRGHAGYFQGSYAHGINAGTEYILNEKWWFGADYIPGSANYTRFGVAYNFTPVTYLTFSVGMPNDSDVNSSEYGITLSTIINLGRSGKGESN